MVEAKELPPSQRGQVQAIAKPTVKQGTMPQQSNYLTHGTSTK